MNENRQKNDEYNKTFAGTQLLFISHHTDSLSAKKGKIFEPNYDLTFPI